MAKLPASKIRTPEPTLAGLPLGETVLLMSSAIKATVEVDFFLNSYAAFSCEKSMADPLWVSREADEIHVAILLSDTWLFVIIPSFFADVSISTATVLEGPDPRLNRDLQAEAKADLAQVAESIKNPDPLLREVRHQLGKEK
jgi:hypothetical protein